MECNACTSNPVPLPQVNAPPIASAHGRKERHVFAHHGKIVARIVEVEDAIVFVFVIVIWKQVDADRCVNLNIEMHIET